MMIPLIILGILSCVNLGMVIAKHGQPEGNYNAWASLISFLITWGLILWIVFSK